MTFKEIRGDLFEDKSGYFAQCISADFACGAGIAVSFNTVFNTKNHLFNLYPDYLSQYRSQKIGGDCLLCHNVFCLITKEHSWEKPTYKTLKKSLEKLRELMESVNVKDLKIPKIACGLDGLNWTSVKIIIMDVFERTDINITVYLL